MTSPTSPHGTLTWVASHMALTSIPNMETWKSDTRHLTHWAILSVSATGRQCWMLKVRVYFNQSKAYTVVSFILLEWSVLYDDFTRDLSSSWFSKRDKLEIRGRMMVFSFSWETKGVKISTLLWPFVSLFCLRIRLKAKRIQNLLLVHISRLNLRGASRLLPPKVERPRHGWNANISNVYVTSTLLFLHILLIISVNVLNDLN